MLTDNILTKNVDTTISPSMFRQHLLAWYRVHGRNLPWRATKDPYKVWISEVILQQTRVAQGLAYYHHFVQTYPSIVDLAHASEQAILRSWQGLGYYRRARHLHDGAKRIVQDYGGRFPTDYTTLLSLKGVGPYTAAAIAAICFKEVVAAVDGNVYRVLARLFGLHENIATSKGKKTMHHLAHRLVDPSAPDTYTQAIMDFGALQCTPQAPLCTTCPFQPFCVAFHTHQTHQLPVKIKKMVPKKRYFDYLVIQYQAQWYMKKRLQGDIWEGMYDFYLLEQAERLALAEIRDPLLDTLLHYQLNVVSDLQEVYHMLTHQRLCVRFHKVVLSSAFLAQQGPLLEEYGLFPYALSAIGQLPKPRLIDAFFEHHGHDTFHCQKKSVSLA